MSIKFNYYINYGEPREFKQLNNFDVDGDPLNEKIIQKQRSFNTLLQISINPYNNSKKKSQKVVNSRKNLQKISKQHLKRNSNKILKQNFRQNIIKYKNHTN